MVMAGDRHFKKRASRRSSRPPRLRLDDAVGGEGQGSLDLPLRRPRRHPVRDGGRGSDQPEVHQVAIFHDATNYGVSGRDDLQREIKKQGDKLQVVATEKFNIGDKDMTAQLLRAKSGGAEAI